MCSGVSCIKASMLPLLATKFVASVQTLAKRFVRWKHEAGESSGGDMGGRSLRRGDMFRRGDGVLMRGVLIDIVFGSSVGVELRLSSSPRHPHQIVRLRIGVFESLCLQTAYFVQ